MSTESTVEAGEAATAVDQSGVDGEGMAAAEGTMRAAIIEQYGAADEFKIRDVPIPALGARQVLVRVHAASVNPVDWKIRNGTLPVGIGRFPLVLGRDCAGVVEKVGEAVTAFKPGDEVFGMVGVFSSGTYAQYTVMYEKELAHKPSSITMQEAAALPLVSLTAWIALREKANVQEGNRVLVLGASGGVGSVAVQLAKHCFKCEVIGTCSGRNVDFVRSLGADRVIDYTQESFWEVEDLLNSCACVIDAAGNMSNQSFPVLHEKGTFVSLMADDMGSVWNRIGFGFSLVYNKVVQYMWNDKYFSVVSVYPTNEMLSSIATAVDDGHLRPIIDSTYDLSAIAEAHERSETKRARGKIVVSVVPDSSE